MAFTAIDLFAGCGGLSLGLKRAGGNIVGAFEVDQWAADTYRRNFPENEMIQCDITEKDNFFWRKNYKGQIDLVVGGPPCQGFSVSGKRQLGEISESNSLVSKFVEIVSQIEPPIVLMENVLGFKTGKLTKSKKVMDYVEYKLSQLGYLVTSAVLSAPEFGVPSLRSRVFILATKRAFKAAPFPIPTYSIKTNDGKKSQISCWDAISDLPHLESGQSWRPEDGYRTIPQNEYQKLIRNGSKFLHNHEAMKHTSRIIERFKIIKQGESAFQLGKKNGDNKITVYKSNNQRLLEDKPSLCITANFQSTYIHPKQHRNLTAREAARLMSFPDDFVFEGKRTQMSSKFLRKYGRENEDFLSQYNQIGNSVPPLLGESIFRYLFDNVDMSKKCKYSGVAGKDMELPF